jgi:Tfp pilus assembly protein PilE
MTSNSESRRQGVPTPDTHQNTERQSNAPDEQIASPATKPEMPPTKCHCYGPHSKKKHWIDYATVIIEIVGLIALCVYAGYTIKIYRANKEAADAAKSAADTAAGQLALTRKTLAATSSAICGPVINNRSDLPYMYFTVACQSGKVDATLQNGEFEASVIDLRTHKTIEKTQKFIVPPQLIRTPGTTKQIDFDILGFSKDAFLSLKQAVVIEGKIEYDDGFDRKIPNPFCIELLPFHSSNGIYNGVVQPPCGGQAEDILRRYKSEDAERK